MNADAIRHFLNYHFAQNRSMWDQYIAPLTDEQFTQGADYSHGSVQDQIVHLMLVDQAWLIGLRGEELPEEKPQFAGRASIRAHWDDVEQQMRGYLDALTDDMLLTKPFTDEEDKDLIVWQVLLHMVNHGTDHRAQILRLLNDLGVKTVSQDYIFYVYDHP